MVSNVKTALPVKAIAAKPDNLNSVLQLMWEKERTTTDKLSSDFQVCLGMYTHIHECVYTRAHTHTHTEPLNKCTLIFRKRLFC